MSIVATVAHLSYCRALVELNNKGLTRFNKSDDTKLCAKISTNEDIEKLQEDVNTLQEWARAWQMQFNVQKCKVMRVGTRK